MLCNLLATLASVGTCTPLSPWLVCRINWSDLEHWGDLDTIISSNAELFIHIHPGVVSVDGRFDRECLTKGVVAMKGSRDH